MKKDAVVVNVARAEIVDEDAIYRHLGRQQGFRLCHRRLVDEGRQGVTIPRSAPLLNLDNFVGTPHASGPSALGRETAAEGSREERVALPKRRRASQCGGQERVPPRWVTVQSWDDGPSFPLTGSPCLASGSEAHCGPDVVVAVELRVPAPFALPPYQGGLLGARPYLPLVLDIMSGVTALAHQGRVNRASRVHLNV